MFERNTGIFPKLHFFWNLAHFVIVEVAFEIAFRCHPSWSTYKWKCQSGINLPSNTPSPAKPKSDLKKKNEMMEKFSGACWSDQNNVSHIQLELVESDLNEKLAKNIGFWFLVNFSFDSDSTNSSRLCETSLWSLQPAPENFSPLQFKC